MLFRTLSAAVYGINADLVDIEVDLTPVRGEADSQSTVTIVGLPDAAVRESRERIRAAITNCGFFFPFQKITINLAPADVRKEGASFDFQGEPASYTSNPFMMVMEKGQLLRAKPAPATTRKAPARRKPATHQ